MQCTLLCNLSFRFFLPFWVITVLSDDGLGVRRDIQRVLHGSVLYTKLREILDELGHLRNNNKAKTKNSFTLSYLLT